MKRNLNWLDRIMLAVTFAEAGCPEVAQGYVAESGKSCDCNSCDEELVDGGGLPQSGVRHCH